MSDTLYSEEALEEYNNLCQTEPLYDYDNYDFKNNCYFPDPEFTSPEFDITHDFFELKSSQNIPEPAVYLNIVL